MRHEMLYARTIPLPFDLEELVGTPRTLRDIPEAVRRSLLEFSCPVATNDASEWRVRNKWVNRVALVCKEWWEDVADAGDPSALQRSVTITRSTAMLFQAAAIPGIGRLCGKPGVHILCELASIQATRGSGTDGLCVGVGVCLCVCDCGVV